jgi:4-hydroxy-tetrahydrodipicolinate reductase
MSMRVAISGAGGRMGRALLEAIAHADDLTLASSFDIGGDVRAALSAADVLIDFTRPEGTLEHLGACLDAKCALVIGTTGFDAAQLARIREAARSLAIVMAPNMSVGVNVALGLVEMASRSLGPEYDVEVFEILTR